jgi:hypothetical protein
MAWRIADQLRHMQRAPAATSEAHGNSGGDPKSRAPVAACPRGARAGLPSPVEKEAEPEACSPVAGLAPGRRPAPPAAAVGRQDGTGRHAGRESGHPAISRSSAFAASPRPGRLAGSGRRVGVECAMGMRGITEWGQQIGHAGMMGRVRMSGCTPDVVGMWSG